MLFYAVYQAYDSSIGREMSNNMGIETAENSV